MPCLAHPVTLRCQRWASHEPRGGLRTPFGALTKAIFASPVRPFKRPSASKSSLRHLVLHVAHMLDLFVDISRAAKAPGLKNVPRNGP